MESSRRDLSIDISEHMPILKKKHNTYHRRFGFTPKTGIAFPKGFFLFLLYKSHQEIKRVLSYFYHLLVLGYEGETDVPVTRLDHF